MPKRYWLVHANGGRQWIDPRQFDLDRLAEQAGLTGGRLVVEAEEEAPLQAVETAALPARARAPLRFEPPMSALGPLFRARLERIHACKVEFELELNTRPTVRVLGGITGRGGWSGSTRTTASSAADRWRSSSTRSCTRWRTTSSTPSPARSTRRVASESRGGCTAGSSGESSAS